MPLSTSQAQLASQFALLTGAKEKIATRYLKSSGFNLEMALDAFYAASDQAAAPFASFTTQLNQAFDQLIRDPKQDGRNEIAVSSTMAYLQSDLGVSLENGEMMVALEIVQAPSLGVITRKEYVEGWKERRIPPGQHAAYVRQQILSLSTDPALFKRVYRHTFVAGKDAGQKSLALETALVYWDLLFAAPGIPWKSASHSDWLGLWKAFLVEKWTRSVSRDMWNQTLEFARKTIEYDGLSFWAEDGAWPTVMDEFVEWYKTARGGDGAEGQDTAMAQ